MPYPSQIDRDTIISTARRMIETDGVDNVSLRAIAKKLGVSAPSLYRYMENKEALLRAVNEVTAREVVETMLNAISDDAPLENQLITPIHVYRQYAHANPITYELLYSNRVSELRPDEDELEQSVLPLQALFAQWAGEENSLIALRGAFAFVHGWVMLEIAGQLRRGGDLHVHFEAAYRAYLAGWKNA
jgi:AcrR family transcriptional regulator